MATVVHRIPRNIPEREWLSSPYSSQQKREIQGQVHHGTGHEGPEGKEKYGYALSLTSAQDGGGWSTPRPSRFISRKGTRYPLCRWLGEHQGRSEHRRKTSPSPGFDPPTVQPVAIRYNNYSIPAHKTDKCKSRDATYQKNKPTKKHLVSAKRRERMKRAKGTAIYSYAVPKIILTIMESSLPS
jgi:hypothetical protein